MFAYASPLHTQKPSAVEEACKAESSRQLKELILIPSESICFPECARAVASDFGNIYAEGQPDLRLSRNSPALAHDDGLFHAWHRRLSDGRFYRGCVEAGHVELLAKRYLAEVFAKLPGSPPAERIHANVQALSGAAANLAVYTALLQPGDGLLGLDLCHGGHLSHGSPFNVSGKQYRVASYGIDEQAQGAARKLDYQRIRELALKHRPRILIGGSSAYPWDFDWKTLRSIADECGAMLMADIAHLAGMVVAGVLNNPLPHAHVVTFTTHKTLCGPRGACIVTTCAETARKIDNAVFPGLQGGPHVNSIAGIARLFEIIGKRPDEYAALQRGIVEHAKILAQALVGEGFALEYGGTNTHLLLIDLKQFPVRGGTARLDGETASRLLENAGIICNKNTLPGDGNASNSSGIRLGTPWITQRGITVAQIRELATLIRKLLGSAQSFGVYAPSGDERCRARVPFEVLKEVHEKAVNMAIDLPYPKRAEATAVMHTTVIPSSVAGRVGLLVRGEKARLALEQACTCDILGLRDGAMAHGFLLRPEGSVIDDVAVAFLGKSKGLAQDPNGEERFVVLAHPDRGEAVAEWLQALSDGFILLDAEDCYCKVAGPFVVEPLPKDLVNEALRQAAKALPNAKDVEHAAQGMLAPAKVFYVGQKSLRERVRAKALPVYAAPDFSGPLKKTIFHPRHVAAGAKLVPFGGWEMPVEYPSGIFKEHAAVRSAAGLFDVSHMSALEVSGPQALAFLETTLANDASRLVPGEAQYSYLLLPDGTALDDLYVYRIGAEHFRLVVNAGNTARDLHWLQTVNAGACAIDPKDPGKRAPGPVTLRDLRDAGKDSLLDLAFQGPLTAEILAELAGNDGQRARILGSRLNDCFDVELGGIPIWVARTGYTGEELGFELFVHPARGLELWDLLLARGKSRGVLPAGLGARDSLRIEAGFPLFGHELEGSEKLSLTEADYGFVVRYHVPFYIGREAYIHRVTPRQKRILRLKGSGRRSVRAGQAILDGAGKVAGVVTSFAFADPQFNFQVLAAVRADFKPKPGSVVKAVRATPDQVSGPVEAEKVVELTVLDRFPTKAEKAGWQAQYRQ